ncbi:MAG TPA: carboxypeptidase, partial [Chloroflexi bacterium]|nr:carboxypeptidase [Chloroflexota bacterium]
NVVPTECHAEVLCVAPTDEAMKEIVKNMMSIAREDENIIVEVEPGPVRPLFQPSTQSMPLINEAIKIASELGLELGHGQFGGGSDGNFTGAMGIPTLDGLGVEGDGHHTKQEHLLVSSLVPRAKLFAGIIKFLSSKVK